MTLSELIIKCLAGIGFMFLVGVIVTVVLAIIAERKFGRAEDIYNEEIRNEANQPAKDGNEAKPKDGIAMQNKQELGAEEFISNWADKNQRAIYKGVYIHIDDVCLMLKQFASQQPTQTTQLDAEELTESIMTLFMSSFKGVATISTSYYNQVHSKIYKLLSKQSCNCISPKPNYPEMIWCDTCGKEIKGEPT